MSTTAYSVTTSATQIAVANAERVGLIIDNQASVIVYIGDSTSLTTANGITLPAGEKLIMSPHTHLGSLFYKGDVYGIVASGTADVRTWELVTTRSF